MFPQYVKFEDQNSLNSKNIKINGTFQIYFTFLSFQKYTKHGKSGKLKLKAKKNSRAIKCDKLASHFYKLEKYQNCLFEF